LFGGPGGQNCWSIIIVVQFYLIKP
jgi:hypothetical protein